MEVAELEENRQTKLQHRRAVYNARCYRDTTPYNVGNLVWLDEKAVSKGFVVQEVPQPLDQTLRIVTVNSDITYRIHFEVTSARQRDVHYMVLLIKELFER